MSAASPCAYVTDIEIEPEYRSVLASGCDAQLSEDLSFLYRNPTHNSGTSWCICMLYGLSTSLLLVCCEAEYSEPLIFVFWICVSLYMLPKGETSKVCLNKHIHEESSGECYSMTCYIYVCVYVCVICLYPQKKTSMDLCVFHWIDCQKEDRERR